MRGAALSAAVSDNLVAGVLQHVGGNQLLRGWRSRAATCSRLSAPTLQNGLTPATKQISDLKTLPTPASTSWCSSTSAISSLLWASMRRAAASASNSGLSTSRIGPRNLRVASQRKRCVHARHRNAKADGDDTRCFQSRSAYCRAAAASARRAGRCANCRSSAYEWPVCRRRRSESAATCRATPRSRRIWPASGVSSLKRVSSGKVERKPVIGLPASARPSARAVRKMVSPSGIYCNSAGGSRCVTASGMRRRCIPSGPGWKPASIRKRAMGCAATGCPLMVVISAP